MWSLSRSLTCIAAVCLSVAGIPVLAQKPALDAPNVVEISPRLITSGQPTADSLATLASQGFGAVIYLAPPTVSDAVRDEALIVGRQGLVFVNIPIIFNRPNEQDYEAFAGVLRSLGDRKVLVHCQVDFRASSMVFLYRTIERKENPKIAFESVSKVWIPEGAWKPFILDQLRKHHIEFEMN